MLQTLIAAFDWFIMPWGAFVLRDSQRIIKVVVGPRLAFRLGGAREICDSCLRLNLLRLSCSIHVVRGMYQVVLVLAIFL